MRKLIFWSLSLLFLVPSVLALAPIENVPNNKFGIHLAVPSNEDLQSAADLVNGNGGKWGYATVVIQDNDQELGKWQEVFNKMRRLKLIPIVRLATHPNGGYWEASDVEDIPKWVNFLNSLNWVIKNRYVILFNEPNHASEWGNRVDAKEYAQIALEFGKALKASNSDYFLMLAGLDQAAPQSPPQYNAETVFLATVIETIGIDNFEQYFNGLSSHSYPNPGFSGSPHATDWGSIRGYESELGLLVSLGVSEPLPVFITETGWSRENLSEATVADYLAYAFVNVWQNDDRVVAVTPFILNYQSEPFLNFSWQRLNEHGFYPQYQTVKNLTKPAGEPLQEESGRFFTQLPSELVEDSSFKFKIKMRNTGQSIWDIADGYELRVVSDSNYYYRFSELNQIEPTHEINVDFEFHTPSRLGKSWMRLGLFKNDQLKFASVKIPIKIIPLQNITLNYRLLSLRNAGDDFQAEIYDQYENLVYVARNLIGKSGQIELKKVRNVAVGEKYRVVLLKPYYLPRQSYLVLQKASNTVEFVPHLPLDWNNDGTWTLKDLSAIFARR